MRHLITLLAACVLTFASAQPFTTPRSYSATNGTVDLATAYGVTHKRDKTLRDLGYNERDAVNNFPAFNMWWTAHGWPSSEMLNLYEFECAFNDAVFCADTYLGIGIYVRSNYVTQSRIWVQCPDGWYRVRFGCMTGIGRYSGKHAQVYSDRSGSNPGSTPGTCIEIDHAGWSSRQPDRVCLNSTAWGKDYGVIGGLAYTEGIIIESFRLVGGSWTGTPSYLCTGVTMNEPGENSVIRYCMAADFPGAGYTIFNGTPTVVETCSAFSNGGPGFDFLGSNGLCNIRIETPSGDNNKGGLIRFRPKDAQSVGGGTIAITSIKSESRGVLQRPVVIEGKMGDLNLTIDGMTANFEGVTCDYLIGGNWTGEQFEISARGIDLRSNTQALFRHGGKGWTLTGGKPYSGNSFTVNDDGLAFRSRSNMVLNGGPTTTPPPVDPPPPTTGTITATASHTGTEGGVLRDAKFMVDGNTNTFWISGRSMTATGDQWIVIDRGSALPTKGVTFGVGGYINSYPRTYTVETSTNGTTWTSRGSFTGAVSSVATFASVTARYIRIKCTAANSNWWAINEASVQ